MTKTNSFMTKALKSKLLSRFPEIHHRTYVYSPPFKKDGKLTIDREKLFRKLNLKKNDLLFMGLQEHTNNIFVIKEKTGSEGINIIPHTDSLITNQKSINLIAYTADCLPVFMYDPIKKVIAIAHAGWKGIVNKIAIKTIEKMEKEFGSKRKDILVYVGPSIGPCCYDDRTSERFEVFKKYKNGAEKRDGQFYINLWAAIKQDLLEFGILPTHLEMSMVCTAETDNPFASHHAEGAKRKSSNISIIAINS